MQILNLLASIRDSVDAFSRFDLPDAPRCNAPTAGIQNSMDRLQACIDDLDSLLKNNPHRKVDESV